MANDGIVAAHAPADPEFGTGGRRNPYLVGTLPVCLSDYTGPRDHLRRTDVAPDPRSFSIAATSAASAAEVSVPTDSPYTMLNMEAKSERLRKFGRASRGSV